MVWLLEPVREAMQRIAGSSHPLSVWLLEPTYSLPKCDLWSSHPLLVRLLERQFRDLAG